ncbi:chromate transporter [Clostridium perfringens]|uniref:Chromate transporter n=1 Tax=Clostridium perfringens TaxID=1502 RepID=A0A2X2YB59_CLOPF|nr:chromate transporter [Clostridium perfringens]
MILIRLFLEFFKVGLFAVGGGAATIPFLYNISDKHIGLHILILQT